MLGGRVIGAEVLWPDMNGKVYRSYRTSWKTTRRNRRPNDKIGLDDGLLRGAGFLARSDLKRATSTRRMKTRLRYSRQLQRALYVFLFVHVNRPGARICFGQSVIMSISKSVWVVYQHSCNYGGTHLNHRKFLSANGKG